MISVMRSATMTTERKRECPLPFPGKKPLQTISVLMCAGCCGAVFCTLPASGRGYIAISCKGEDGPQEMWPIACGMLHNSTLKRLLQFGIAIKRGGVSLQDRMDKEKKPYIFVGLVCVREKYQGQGYMRKVLDIAFAEGDRLGVPVILETDAKSKCDKYVHLGMELAGTHDLGAFGKLYDLIKYPKPSNENGTV